MKMWGRWRGKGEKPIGDEEVREKPMEDEKAWGKNPWEMKRRGGKSVGDEKMKDEMWEKKSVGWLGRL